MTKEQEVKARASFTGIDINELLSDKCLIRLTQQQYQDGIQLVLHLDNKIRILTNDNEQLMAQISAKAEQPKPLLAEAKKNDKVRHRNGKISRITDIESVPAGITGGWTTCIYTDLNIGMGCSLTGKAALGQSEYDIIEIIVEKQDTPLLAEAKVGDLCQRRDGKWVQIDAIRNNGNKWSIFEAEGHSYHESGNAVCSELYHTELDIVSTEPLAAEGSAEWAWQMWQLGNSVHNTGSHLLWSRDRKVKNVSKGQWLKELASFPTGWQLYEPKQEPCPACNGTGKVEKPAPAFKVGDWVTDGVINGNITSLTDDLAWVKTGFYEYRMSLRNLTPISPSDVVVDFGSFRGTIELNSHPFRKQITVKNTQGDAIAYINIVYIDTPTRELVQELIEKQEEEK